MKTRYTLNIAQVREHLRFSLPDLTALRIISQLAPGQVIVGSLEPLASYRGPFALLRTDGIACELAEGGYNSSVRGEWSGMELGMTGGVVFSSGFD